MRFTKAQQLERFDLRDEEKRMMDLLRVKPLTVDELVRNAEGLSERAAKLLVYCLLITKQIETIAASSDEPQPPSSDSESRIPVASPSSNQPVARVKVKRAIANKSYPIIEEHLVNAATDQRRSPVPGTLTAQEDPRRKEIIERSQVIDKMDYFAMLGLAETATAEEVKAAYFGLARTWHPDKLPSHLSEVKDQCSRVFARLSEAHATLIDSEKRARYIQVMKEGGATPEEQDAVANVLEATIDFQKAEISLRRGDNAGAEALARKAHQADPQQAEYLAMLAWLEALKPDGQSPEATQAKIAMLNKACSMNAKCERAFYYRAMLHKRAGYEEQAIADFKTATTLNVHNVDAQRELRLLEMRRKSGASKPPEAEKTEKAEKTSLFGRLFKK